MKRQIGTGLSILLFSALTISAAKAETRNEQQFQSPDSGYTSGTLTESPGQAPIQKKVEITEEPVAERTAVIQEQAPKLAERDRLIREYQTQTIIDR